METTRSEYLTSDDVAALLLVDPRTVRNWIAFGRLPAVRPGRRWLVSRLDLYRFIEATRTTPPSAILDQPIAAHIVGVAPSPSPIEVHTPPPVLSQSRAERRRNKLPR